MIALIALAQASSLRIVCLLVLAGKDGLPAGEIAEQLGIPFATFAFHLKELSHAGLEDSGREGRSLIYLLRVDGMRDLQTFLARDARDSRKLVGLCAAPSHESRSSLRSISALVPPLAL